MEVRDIMNSLSILKNINKIPCQKINPNTLGYIHSTGEISFATENAAINYAKKRIVTYCIVDNIIYANQFFILVGIVCVFIFNFFHNNRNLFQI